MFTDRLSSVLPRPRPGKQGRCDFYPFRYLSGQLIWERCLEGGKWTTKSNSSRRHTSIKEKLNPNVHLWQNHKQLKMTCAVIGVSRESCKGLVLSSQPLIKSLHFERIINLIFAEAFWWWYDASHPELQHTVDRKKHTGWQKPPYLDSFKPLCRNL